MSRTNRQFFLIRKTDVSNETQYNSDDRFTNVALHEGWLVGVLENSSHADEIADDYLTGWGDAYYIRDPIGGGGSFTAYRCGEYGVERIATNGFRGGYHYVQKYISNYRGHGGLTEPPESLPTNLIDD